jgi:hypothetical protein
MTCYACHSAWTTSCFGCHLSMKANQKKPMLHNEGGDSRNWTSYNFQTLRDDIYFLAKDGTVTKNRIAPARSLVRDPRLLAEPEPRVDLLAAADGVVGRLLGPGLLDLRPAHGALDGDQGLQRLPPVRGGRQQRLDGTGPDAGHRARELRRALRLVGEGSSGFEGVVVTERDEPQAVIGSRLHQLAYPEEYSVHSARGRLLREAYGHGGETLSLQLRGEYLFAAQGHGGLRIYDVAQVDHKGFSERLVSAPVSPLGQRLSVDTKDATSVALPATMTIDPTRAPAASERRAAGPSALRLRLRDGPRGGPGRRRPAPPAARRRPDNNFVERAATFDGGGALRGATSIWLAGTTAYVTTPRGLAIVDLDDPRRPRLVAHVGTPLRGPRAVAVQLATRSCSTRTGSRSST